MHNLGVKAPKLLTHFKSKNQRTIILYYITISYKQISKINASLLIEHYKQKVKMSAQDVTTPTSHTDQNASNSSIPAASTDPFDSLIDKMNESDLKLTRKIFELFTVNCPKKHLELIEELKKKVIKDLE